MASITIFGSGGMGTAIGQLLTDGGSTVEHVSRADDATISGDIAILAVPYEALESIVDEYRDQLVGKTVVDITNPLDFETFDALKVPVDSSAAAELQSALPDSRVLKAFNTTFAATLATKAVGPNTTTVLVAGDDTDAKQALDAGALDRARQLEALGFLQLTLANAERIAWSGGFAIVV